MKKNKKTMIAMLLGLIAAPAIATEVSDTLVIEDVNKVKIETRDTVQRIVINGTKADPEFQYVQRISIPDTSAVRRTIRSIHDFNKQTIKKNGKETKWSHTLHLNIGLNAMLDTPDGYDFKVWPSLELGIGSTWDWHPYGKQNEWSIGWGVNWRAYSLDNDTHWTKANNLVTLMPYASDMKDRSTSLHEFSIQMPLLYTHYFDKKQSWSVTLGATVNWNCYAAGQRTYELDDEDYEVETKKIGQRPFTVDGYVKLDFPKLPAIYCKYCPMEFFKKDRGPKMHQLSFGVCL